jgi:hypothetical protein
VFVASPLPRRIVEIDAVQKLWDTTVVITCGGGGIPVVENADGTLEGVAAVIDKDYAAELLAEQIDADVLMILTEVEKVAINYGKPNQENLSHLPLSDAARYVGEGHFAPGSMLPKVQAAMKFIRANPDKKAIITSLDKADRRAQRYNRHRRYLRVAKFLSETACCVSAKILRRIIMETKKVSLLKSVLFTICSILVLDTFVAPAIIGVSSITIWVITAIVFFVPYGLLSAELGSTYPDDGGIYSWVKRAFGEGPAVLTGWYYWVNVAFWMPAVFIAFAAWISYLFFPAASPWVLCAIAVIMCWVVVYIGIRGIELSVTVTTIAAVCKVAVLLIFGGLGIVYGIKNGLANDFSLKSFIPTFATLRNILPRSYTISLV